MKINLTTLFILFIYSTVCARAQFNETIRADRPGQAIVPFTVGKYIFQTQTGIDIGGSNSSESTIISRFYAPNISLRFGLTKNVELVSNWEYRYDRNNTNNTINSTYGLSLSSIGSRINFYEGKSYEPSIGLQLTFKLPILAEAYNPNYIAPKITLISSQPITKDIGFTLNIGVNYNGNTAIPTTFYVGNLGYSLSPTWSVFAENYGDYKENTFENRWDAGVGYLVNNNLQIDAYGGAGYNNNTVDYFASIGFSWRFITLHN